jgi:hypothetical protein
MTARLIQQPVVRKKAIAFFTHLPQQAPRPQKGHYGLARAGAANNQVPPFQRQGQSRILVLIQILDVWQFEAARTVDRHG